MKTAWLLHGTGGSAKDYYWFADTKKYLESKGYKVWWPELPHTAKPELIETEDFIGDFSQAPDKDTVIIGHSSACPVILDYLQWLRNITVKQVILVSGFYESIDDEGFSERMIPTNFNWEAIKRSAKEIVFINSDNDPWGCDDKQARPVAEKLGAKFILAKGQGHMGSETFNQPYKELEILRDLIK